MPQLWEKHYLTDITGQIEHAGAGDVELPSMCIFFFMRMYARDFFSVVLFGVLGPRCWTGSSMLDCPLVEEVWYIYDWDTG